jgi:hypothetical protein
MKRPGIASTVWFLAFVGAILFRQAPGVALRDNDIVFAPKNFADIGQSVVGISGTLTGDDLGYKNNTTVVYCEKGRKEGFFYSIEQIGHNQIGRLDYPGTYPITTWNAYEVIATENVSDWNCGKTTITLQRKRQTAVWVEEPVNQARADCKDAETRIYKWTIEDSPGWKAVMGK